MSQWVSGILDLTSNIYWVIGIFMFFTLFLHLIFVRWFPLSLRIWKMADYLWLILVFLSILGLVGEARQFRAQSTHQESEWLVTQGMIEVRNWYTNYHILICEEAEKLKEKNLENTKYPALCDFLEGSINDLNLLQRTESEFPELTPSLSKGLAEYTAIIPRLEQNILKRRIAHYNEKRALHIVNITESKRSRLQMILLILAPVMFALALAIRFTKVTAEYRLLHPRNK